MHRREVTDPFHDPLERQALDGRRDRPSDAYVMEQRHPRVAPGQPRSTRFHQMPRRVEFVLGQIGDVRLGLRVVEIEERERSCMVDPGDEPRRRATETSPSGEQQQGSRRQPWVRHRPSLGRATGAVKLTRCVLLTSCSRQDDMRGHRTTPIDMERHVERDSVRGASNLRIRWPRGRGSSSLPSRTGLTVHAIGLSIRPRCAGFAHGSLMPERSWTPLSDAEASDGRIHLE